MEGRFTGTIWQRWSEGLFSLVVMYASRFRNCAFAERVASEAHLRKSGAKSRGRPYGGKFMWQRRSWMRGPGPSGAAVFSVANLPSASPAKRASAQALCCRSRVIDTLRPFQPTVDTRIFSKCPRVSQPPRIQQVIKVVNVRGCRLLLVLAGFGQCLKGFLTQSLTRLDRQF